MGLFSRLRQSNHKFWWDNNLTIWVHLKHVSFANELRKGCFMRSDVTEIKLQWMRARTRITLSNDTSKCCCFQCSSYVPLLCTMHCKHGSHTKCVEGPERWTPWEDDMRVNDRLSWQDAHSCAQWVEEAGPAGGWRFTTTGCTVRQREWEEKSGESWQSALREACSFKMNYTLKM